MRIIIVSVLASCVGGSAWAEQAPASSAPRLGVLVHHTDAEREWSYDRDSHIGQLVRGLDEGPKRGWVIVDMKSDWNVIYPMPR
jgi:hypothetical protein